MNTSELAKTDTPPATANVNLIVPTSATPPTVETVVDQHTSPSAGDEAASRASLLDAGRDSSPQTKLLALIQVDKQPEAASYILDIAKDARQVGEPIDARRSSLRDDGGAKYRRSKRTPMSEAYGKKEGRSNAQ
jgi:hypothetical protein